jgi:phosphoglycolate phosphatase-like HAD superfamily hydrolase
MLGLPQHVRACLFDLDGVLTRTAEVHRAAWGEVFDSLLAERGTGPDQRFTEADYLTYVDGKPRRDGVRDFRAFALLEHGADVVVTDLSELLDRT